MLNITPNLLYISHSFKKIIVILKKGIPFAV